MTSTVLRPDPLDTPAAATPPGAAPGPPGAAPGPPGAPPARPADPRWVRPALVGLLAVTAVGYLWDLAASGWANAFYSAAAQAGMVSWKAFFYGSSDAGNSITVDKTPLALWVMGISARIFGLNPWSLLVPEALMGVASVGLLFATVRRWAGGVAGLIAGAVLALTPVAVLMFRFDNPDAAMVLLLLGGAYATVRATEVATTRAGTRWLALAGACVGLGFLAKMLQAFLVVPVFALVFLVAAAGPVRRRLVQLALAGLAMLVAGGWWVAIVELVPASARPYIGGSQTNSVLDLMFGYNGFGRLTGDETGSVGGGRGWGQSGWTRMFDGEIGGQVAWLLPAALVLLVVGLARTARAPRTDRLRAAYLLWGGWLMVTGLTFSLMAGIFHPYYTVALAPGIGGVVGIGAVHLWRERRAWPAAILGGVVVLSAVWAWDLLGRSADFVPWLRPLVLLAGAVAGVGIAGVGAARAGAMPRPLAVGAAGLGLATVLAGPAAYAVQTAATPHTGAIPSAGPAVAGGFGGPGGGPGGFGGQGRRGQIPQGGFGGQAQGGFGGGAGRAGGMGGLLDARTPSSELVALLRAGASSYTWAAATVGSNNSAGYQLASGEAVMPIGGFNGTDPAPTLAQFQQDVAAGRIHYFIGGGLGMGGMGTSGSQPSSAIAGWVASNFNARTVGGVTVYDLTVHRA
jgi:4-amino-4-deoxy-L-arabinose transferase-like glycosyltransferase